MNTYQILILFSTVIIFSYLFDLFSKKTRFPSILLLLMTGYGMKQLSDYLSFPIIDFSLLLPVLGNLGLLLIVLEGALELHFDKEKLGIIKKSFGAALLPMLATIAAIAGVFVYLFQTSLHTSLLNAVPFAVISSAIAIPSVAALSNNKKEFIVYESTFSDILGIIIFNYLFINETFTFFSLAELSMEILLIVAISVVCSFGILFLLGKITHHVKFYLLLSIMILVYGIGKSFHLSSLIVILAVGLFLNNATLLLKNAWLKNKLIYPTVKEDVSQLLHFTGESAFLLRTFFFLIFGYTLSMGELIESEVAFAGILLLIIIYAIRFVYLKWIAKTDLMPEVVITPRGLISILLFYQIPTDKWVTTKENGLVLFLIVGTSIFMTIGLLFSKKSTISSTH